MKNTVNHIGCVFAFALTLSFATDCFGQYEVEVLADEPLAYYRFEEPAGAEIIEDSSGDHDSVEVNNAVLGVPGRVGNAVEFNGDGSIVLDLFMDPFQPSDDGFDFSIEMLVSNTAIPTQVMAAQKDGSGLGRSNLILNGGGQWGSFIGGSTTSSEITPEEDTWYHLVMTYDGDFEEIIYYVDGEATVDPIIQTVESADGNWVLGSHKNQGSQFVDGLMDEVAFYDYRLDDPDGDDDIDDSRVLTHFNALPELVSLIGDCDGSGVLDAADLACVATVEERDAVLTALNTVPGDLDGDGSVAFADFLLLSNNFGQADVSYAGGNIDLAGNVDFADFLALSDNFGASSAAAAVPEPASHLLMFLAFASLAMLRKNRRK